MGIAFFGKGGDACPMVWGPFKKGNSSDKKVSQSGKRLNTVIGCKGSRPKSVHDFKTHR